MENQGRIKGVIQTMKLTHVIFQISKQRVIVTLETPLSRPMAYYDILGFIKNEM